jgi:hypothetical protein
MGGLRQCTKNVGDLVKPTALLSGLREHLPQRAPEPECAVAHGQDRGAHPAPGAVAEQVRPGLGGLPVPVGERDEFLAAISADTDYDQQAQLVLFQANVDVDAVDPQVDVVHTRQIPVGEGALLGFPGLGQLRDHRCREPGRAAQELAQRGHEVPGREPVQVQQRQHLGDLRGLAAPGGQDRRGEPSTLAGVGVDAAVVDPRCGHLHGPSAGEHLAR